jgi:hypothetical protein
MRVVILLFVLFAGPACAASLMVAGDQLILSGKLDDSELAQFRDAAAAHGKTITTVILRDLRPAGTLLDSARMAADYVREQGWRTAVSGNCSGACAIIYLGGVSRHFTDDKPAGNTRVGLSGWYFTEPNIRNYGKNEFSPFAARKARHWIKESTQGKISEQVLDLFAPLEWSEASNTAYFYDSRRLKRADGLSVFVCNAKNPAHAKVINCKKIETDAYKEGIVTSSELIRSNDQPAK